LPLSWLKEHDISVENVSLYRLEKDVWVAYPAKKTSQYGADVRFTAVVPGFSYFAVGGIPSKVETAIPIIPSTLPQPNTQPLEQANGGAAENTTASSHGPEIITKAPKKQSIPWLIIFLVVVVVGGLTYVGFDQYRKQQEKNAQAQVKIKAQQDELSRRQEIVKDGEQVGLMLTKPLERKEEHDPMAALHQYIVAMRQKNRSDEEIRAKLVTAGWDPTIVDLELLRK
jgi:hypothetical protein